MIAEVTCTATGLACLAWAAFCPLCAVRSLELVLGRIAAALVGLSAVVLALALAGAANAGWVSLGWSLLLACTLAWDRRRARSPDDPSAASEHARDRSRSPGTPAIDLARWEWLALGIIVAVGLLLRAPPTDVSLAGRDQGSYALRAKALVRTGTLTHVDPVLAQRGAPDRAGAGTASPQGAAPVAGVADLVGLYPRAGEGWRHGRYEAAYRPGAYLADRARGHVVAQFLHGFPALLAACRLIGKNWGESLALGLLSLLWIGAGFSVGRRLWQSPLAGLVIAAILALAPVSVWVGRTTLSETMTGPLALVALAGLMAADDADDAHARTLRSCAVVCLAALPWIRGNAWVTTPVWILAAGLLIGARARGLTLAIAASSIAAFVVHAWTCFPYVYDELARMLASRAPTTPVGASVLLIIPTALATLPAILATSRADSNPTSAAPVTDAGDDASIRRSPHAAASSPGGEPARAPPDDADREDRRVSAVVTTCAFVSLLTLSIWWLRSNGGPPWSRVDAWIALGGLAPIAVLGAISVVAGPTPRSRHTAWLSVHAALVAATLVLFTPRVLPQLGLWYHGRYWYGELLPASALLACAGADRLARVIATDQTVARVRTLALAAIVAAVAFPLLLWPAGLIREFDGAGAFIDALEREIEPDAIVIAGGEGWHHAHTFNQVGGALALSRHATVLPYRDRDSTWATAWELLVRGKETRPVYLLVNEASHEFEAEVEGAPVSVSVWDDGLSAPFSAERVVLFDLLTHRLTPTPDPFARRITRDGLRAALIRLRVDPDALARVERWFPSGHDAASDEWRLAQGPSDWPLREGDIDEPAVPQPARCPVPGHDTVIAIPPGPLEGPMELAIVLSGRAMARDDRIELAVDGRRLPLRAAAGGARERDTYGPWPLAGRPNELRLRPAAKPARGGPCPHGALAEIRLLPAPRAVAQDALNVEALTIQPAHAVGPPPRPRVWTTARTLSRHRPLAATASNIETEGESLVLVPGRPITFAPIDLPAELSFVHPTLAASRTGAPATLLIRIDGVLVAQVPLGVLRERAFVAPSVPLVRGESQIPWRGGGGVHVVSIALEMNDGATSEATAEGAAPRVLLRDLTFHAPVP